MSLRRILVVVAILVASAFAQTPDFRAQFDRRDAMIPMRDGVKLYTEIYTQKNATAPLPFLFTRTPYGVKDDDNGYAYGLRSYQEFMPDGYIFVFQDIRGRFKSEGQFVMNRTPRRDPKGIDEATDTYDTIDWLLKNVASNNRRVGILGISYGGYLTMMAAMDPHPALKAASEQASPADMFLGDDFHHNGAFRLSYGFEYASMMETDKTNFSFHFDQYDTYQWYLALGALSNANARYFHGKLPTWNAFVEHPNYDDEWKDQAWARYLHEVKVPMLNVAGWWDQEDFYGPQTIYAAYEKNDPRHMNFFVAGPWNHGGWSRSDGSTLGPLRFGSNTSEYFRKNIQAPWFAYFLHDKGKLPFTEAMTFETGSNEWKKYDSWPPRQAQARKLYLHAGRSLSFDPPSTSVGTPAPGCPGEQSSPTAAAGASAGQPGIPTCADFDSYLSDPANPVPYRPRPVTPTYPGPEWPVWLLQDQRFVDHRPDVLSYETDVLDHDVTVAGDIVAHLFASTSGTDSDWIVKLIDVYPEDYKPESEPTASTQPRMQTLTGGYELIVADEVFRGRFHNSFEKPEALPSGSVVPYTIDLHTSDHVVAKGHRIMVQVQSTWFPLIDRNPQKFVPNIFEAKDADYQPATQHVYHSAQFPSYVELPVMRP